MAYGTVNADVIGTSVAGSNLGAGNASSMKNRIINGAMVIDQRNAGASVAFSTAWKYYLDRWQGRLMSASGSPTIGQSSSYPVGFSNSLIITNGTGVTPAAGETNTIQQTIEGYNIADLNWGTVNAKSITLSFWVKSSLTGTFGGSLSNGSSTRSYPFTYSISAANTWEQKSITIAGDTTGTWASDNTGGLQVFFDLGTGSTYQGTAGSWAGADYRAATGCVKIVSTTSATFYITGVQVEVGSSATGFDYRQYTTELQLCQRYLPAFNYVSNGIVCTAVQYGGSTLFANIVFPVTARVFPTGATVTGSVVAYPSGNTSSGGSFNASSQYVGQIGFTLSGTAGQAQDVRANSATLQILFTGCEL